MFMAPSLTRVFSVDQRCLFNAGVGDIEISLATATNALVGEAVL